MSTGSGGSGGPSPFSDAEVAALTEPRTDPELEEVEPAEIDAAEQETPFEKIVARSRRLDVAQVKAVVESVLFVAPHPLSVDQLFETTGVDRDRLLQALSALRDERAQLGAGVSLQEVAGGWQFRTVAASAEYVRRFLKVKPQRLTRAAVETLAIIAYRQPCTRPELEELRGVDSGAVLKALLDRRLIKIVGKKEDVGRPILYGTTREFLEFFALKDLNALPTLREFQELTEEHQEIVEKEAPRPTAAGTVESLADPTFKQRVADQERASEAALEKLESAIETADVTAKAASKVLDPPAPPPPEGTPPADGGTTPPTGS